MTRDLPPLAPVPPLRLRVELAPEEWEACLDAWVALTELYLRLPADKFLAKSADDGPLAPFLASYFREAAAAGKNDIHFSHPTAAGLNKISLHVLHRIFSSDKPPPSSLLRWEFLADLSQVFAHSEALPQLLRVAFEKHGNEIELGLQTLKNHLIQKLDSGSFGNEEATLQKLAYLIGSCPEIGEFFMTGSDFLDSLTGAYGKASQSIRKKLVAIAYGGLSALLRPSRPSYSVLSDHLYSLKSQTSGQKESLLADLVTNTSILSKIQENTSSTEGSRARNLATSLGEFRNPALARPKRNRQKTDKGKGRAVETVIARGEQHFHKMSLVSQVQDLFPDLGSGFVMKLLDEYNDNVEMVTAHLLEDTLPAHLATADRKEQIPELSAAAQRPHFTPRSTPPPERKNVFDNDDFDRLSVDMSRIHFGRKEKGTADVLLSDKEQAPNKAAILSALAAFDSDDDERDDTYDIEDVGGMINTGSEEADADLTSDTEEALVKAFLSSPELFERDAATKRGAPRQALKEQTGMTDEAIEGWAVMIKRDPRKLRRLEEKYTAFTGQQRSLPSTAYRSSPADSGAEDDGSGGDGQHGRGGRGRGRGGRGRGRGRGRGGNADGGAGSADGPSNRGNPQVNRARKEANKSSRANHNRRDQRAKKMARGGFAG